MRVTSKRSEGGGFRPSAGFEINIDGEYVGNVFLARGMWTFRVGSEVHCLAKHEETAFLSSEAARAAAVAHVKKHGMSRTPERDAEIRLDGLRWRARNEAQRMHFGATTKAVILLVDANGSGDVAIGSTLDAAEVRTILERAYRTAPSSEDTKP